MGLLSKCRDVVTRYEMFEQIAADGYAFVCISDNNRQRINMRLQEIDDGLTVSNCNHFYIGNAADLSAVSTIRLEDSQGRCIIMPFQKNFHGCDNDTKIGVNTGDIKLSILLNL